MDCNSQIIRTSVIGIVANVLLAAFKAVVAYWPAVWLSWWTLWIGKLFCQDCDEVFGQDDVVMVYRVGE